MIVKTEKGDLPVKFGFNAYAKFGDLTGKKMNDVMAMDLTDMSLSDVLKFIYVGFYFGAKAEGKECELTVEDIGDMIDTDPDLIKRVMSALAEQMPEDGGDKKK